MLTAPLAIDLMIMQPQAKPAQLADPKEMATVNASILQLNMSTGRERRRTTNSSPNEAALLYD